MSTVGLVLLVILAGACVDKGSTDGISQQLVISTQLSKSFEVFTKRMSWSQAVLFCKERYGDLATIRSQEEMYLLNNMTAHDKTKAHSYWIGGTKLGSSRGYFWLSDGRPLSCHNSLKYTDVEGGDCLLLKDYSPEDGWGWTTEDCSSHAAFICEHF